ncbi:DNA-binding protein [Limimaricola soesokkakensis]|uniref:DNA-binding protein n=1 Tax=Limimaricola soesokkakensis TaxID=1343159 RepID=UPI0035165B89
MAIKETTKAALEKKIRAAMAELERDGIRITNSIVREKVKTGSFRDISPIVKAIRAEKEVKAKAESQVPDMPEEIAELATAIWEGAYRCADEVAAAERQAHAKEIKELKIELADKENEVTIVESEMDEAMSRADNAEAKIVEQDLAIQGLKILVASLEGRLQGRADGSATQESNADDRQKAVVADLPGQQDMFDSSGEAPSAIASTA